MPSYSVENISNKSKRASRIYKDLDLDLGRNSTTNDVNKLTDVRALTPQRCPKIFEVQ